MSDTPQNPTIQDVFNLLNELRTENRSQMEELLLRFDVVNLGSTKKQKKTKKQIKKKGEKGVVTKSFPPNTMLWFINDYSTTKEEVKDFYTAECEDAATTKITEANPKLTDTTVKLRKIGREIWTNIETKVRTSTIKAAFKKAKTEYFAKDVQIVAPETLDEPVADTSTDTSTDELP